MGYSKPVFGKKNIMKILILLFMLLPIFTINGQNGFEQATKLRQNVVRVIADTEGFGFVVSVNGGYAYIVTANHVVRNSTSIKVKFFDDQAVDYDAKDLGLRYASMDISLLKVAVPNNLKWEKKCYSEDIQAAMPAFFVGRNAKWYIPTGPAICSINDLTPDNIIIIDSSPGSIQPGTSGAPLITKAGIIGLIYNDESGRAEAYSIKLVKGIISKVWNYNFDLESNDAVTKSNPSQTETGDPIKVNPPQNQFGEDIDVNNIATYIGNNKWTWTIFVDGSESTMNSIKCVQYVLHPTFPNPVQTICERGNTVGMNFPLTASGWGTFSITVKVIFISGGVKTFKHELKF
jgi:hypothetical protein